jgi:DNA-binding XRE family transcriptional regulator
MDKFIGRVKEIREELSLSQEKFAEIVGLSRTTILRIENRKSEPRLRTVFKIKRFCEENNIEFDVFDNPDS